MSRCWKVAGVSGDGWFPKRSPNEGLQLSISLLPIKVSRPEGAHASPLAQRRHHRKVSAMACGPAQAVGGRVVTWAVRRRSARGFPSSSGEMWVVATPAFNTPY